MMNQCVIGVDLNATEVKGALLKDNCVQSHITQNVRKKDDEKALINQVAELIDELLVPEVKGIGLGVPSVVDTEKGIVYNAQNIPSWKEVPLKEMYQNRFRVPVFVNNDANCFALGEKYFGMGQAYNSFAAVTIGSGIGAGLVLNGKLYEGPNCGAGEVGMLPYRESIIEQYCSEIFFAQREGITAHKACELASSGDGKTRALFDEFGVHLGIAMEAIIYAYDPEVVILGGALSKAYAFFKNTMYSSLESFAYQNSLKKIKIKVSDDDFMAVKGAAALALAC